MFKGRRSRDDFSPRECVKYKRALSKTPKRALRGILKEIGVWQLRDLTPFRDLALLGKVTI